MKLNTMCKYFTFYSLGKYTYQLKCIIVINISMYHMCYSTRIQKMFNIGAMIRKNNFCIYNTIYEQYLNVKLVIK